MFAGSFWSHFSITQTSTKSFELLLQKPDLTIEDLLQDEDFISQLGMQNPKLLSL